MKGAPEEIAIAQKIALFGLLWGTLAGIAQTVCLLAIIEPHSWEKAASFACWVYAGYHLEGLLGMTGAIAACLVTSKAVSKKASLPWLLFSAVCNLAIITLLTSYELKLALTLAGGYSAFSAVKSWVLLEEAEEAQQASSKINALFQSLLFIILIASLDFGSIPLAILLFVLFEAWLTSEFLKFRRKIRKPS